MFFSLLTQQVCILLFGQTLSDDGNIKESTDSHPEKLKREIGTSVDSIPSDGEIDEKTFQKPSKPSKEYDDFINFLYRKDGEKSTVSKTKREATSDSAAGNKIQVGS